MTDELDTCIKDISRIIQDSHTFYYQLVSLSHSIPPYAYFKGVYECSVFNKGSEGLTKDLLKLQSVLCSFEYFCI